MAVRNSNTHRWEQAGDAYAMIRRAAQCSFLTRDEEAEFARLVAWFLAWEPPAEGYPLSPGVEVVNPKLSHAYACERIREGCWGQPQRHLLDWLRRHWRLFGEA